MDKFDIVDKLNSMEGSGTLEQWISRASLKAYEYYLLEFNKELRKIRANYSNPLAVKPMVDELIKNNNEALKKHGLGEQDVKEILTLV